MPHDVIMPGPMQGSRPDFTKGERVIYQGEQRATIDHVGGYRDGEWYVAITMDAGKFFRVKPRDLEKIPSRSYVVGLPVVVTVHEDGVVTYEVDTSEAGEGIRENYPDLNEEPPGDADPKVWHEAVQAEVDKDAELVEKQPGAWTAPAQVVRK